MVDTCPEELLVELLERVAEDGTAGLAALDRLLEEYPGDPRLHFLHGSLLAAEKRYDEAREAMAKAVEIAPDYDLARFQLGFLAFTSGDAQAASAAWARLLDRDSDNPLRLFAEGLERLAVDDFEGSAERLRRGIAANPENPPLNRDMTLIIDAMPRPPQPDDGQDEPSSLTQLALQQSAARKSVH
jgi:tetratricopeptide (TPR) repeat protein